MVTAHLRHTFRDPPGFVSPPTVAQIERQIRWEGAAVEAGVKRYREEISSPAHEGPRCRNTSSPAWMTGEVTRLVAQEPALI